MSDEQNPVESGSQPDVEASAENPEQLKQDEGVDAPVMYTEAELKEAFRKRDAAKQRAKDLEAKLSEYHKREREREFKSLSMEQQLEETKKELEELRSAQEQAARKHRQQTFLDRVVAKTGLSPGVARGLLLAAAQDHDLDIAPEDFGETDVKAAASLMKKIDPEPFAPRVGGTPAPSPGISARSVGRGELPSNDFDALTAQVIERAQRAGGPRK